LAFLAWAHDCGDDLLVGVEFEGGGRTMRFCEIADLLLGLQRNPIKDERVRLEFI